jgi:hypothetical protein
VSRLVHAFLFIPNRRFEAYEWAFVVVAAAGAAFFFAAMPAAIAVLSKSHLN